MDFGWIVFLIMMFGLGVAGIFSNLGCKSEKHRLMFYYKEHLGNHLPGGYMEIGCPFCEMDKAIKVAKKAVF